MYDVEVRTVATKDVILEGVGAVYEPLDTIRLKESVSRTGGFAQLPSVYDDGSGKLHCFDGNHRLLVARELGIEKVPVAIYSASPSVPPMKFPVGSRAWAFAMRANAQMFRRTLSKGEASAILKAMSAYSSEDDAMRAVGMTRKDFERILAGPKERPAKAPRPKMTPIQRSLMASFKRLDAGDRSVLDQLYAAAKSIVLKLRQYEYPDLRDLIG